jgi:hypothetical protein
LLLVDGLDEIASQTMRLEFVRQLTTFLAIYPAVRAVITSREAGFRLVAGMLGTVCEQYAVAEFSNDDIRKLTLAWHREVVGESARVAQDAEALADAVIQNDRVRRLASNPLLLTTLLLVKRWVGELPQRRSVLYGKAIEVLLMTWNIEGHERIELDEAIPQLAFLAYAMLVRGVQQVSQVTLREVLADARCQLPDLLAFARIGINDFVDRIEDRSSLVVLAGHEVEDGELRAFYEFKHLTFQEYLAAKAIAEGYVPGGEAHLVLDRVLEPHFNDPQWREVVPLVAVLSGRQAGSLVRTLIRSAEAEERPDTLEERKVGPSALLRQCLVDEVQIPPNLLAEAIQCVVRRAGLGGAKNFEELLVGKYGGFAREQLRMLVQSGREATYDVVTALAAVAKVDILQSLEFAHSKAARSDLLGRISHDLDSSDLYARAVAMTAIMQVAFELYEPSSSDIRLHRNSWPELSDLAARLPDMLDAGPIIMTVAVAWALAWLAEVGEISASMAQRLIPRLFALWHEASDVHIGRVMSWAIAEMPMIDDGVTFSSSLKTREARKFLREQIVTEMGMPEMRRAAAAVIGYYMGDVWDRQQLAELITDKVGSVWLGNWSAYRVIAARLGVKLEPPGRPVR